MSADTLLGERQKTGPVLVLVGCGLAGFACNLLYAGIE